jgi:hypothetical protein
MLKRETIFLAMVEDIHILSLLAAIISLEKTHGRHRNNPCRSVERRLDVAGVGAQRQA